MAGEGTSALKIGQYLVRYSETRPLPYTISPVIMTKSGFEMNVR